MAEAGWEPGGELGAELPGRSVSGALGQGWPQTGLKCHLPASGQGDGAGSGTQTWFQSYQEMQSPEAAAPASVPAEGTAGQAPRASMRHQLGDGTARGGAQPSLSPPESTVGRGQDTQRARGGGQVGQDPAAGHAAALQYRNRRQKGPGTGPRSHSCPSQPRAGGCSHDVPAGGARRDPKTGVWAASTPSPPWPPFPAWDMLADGNGGCGWWRALWGQSPPAPINPGSLRAGAAGDPRGSRSHPTDLRAPAQPAVDGMCLPHGY